MECNCGKLLDRNGNGIKNQIANSMLDQRIVGGNRAPEYSIPWQVGLYHIEINVVFCGGTIIGPFTIMTAAHCLVDIDVSQIYVFATSTDISEIEGNLYPVEETISHPKYKDSNVIFDFAILKLKKPIPFGRKANAACLPQDPFELYVGANLMVSGWGNMAPTGGTDQFPNELQVTLPKFIKYFPKRHLTFSSLELKEWTMNNVAIISIMPKNAILHLKKPFQKKCYVLE